MIGLLVSTEVGTCWLWLQYNRGHSLLWLQVEIFYKRAWLLPAGRPVAPINHAAEKYFSSRPRDTSCHLDADDFIVYELLSLPAWRCCAPFFLPLLSIKRLFHSPTTVTSTTVRKTENNSESFNLQKEVNIVIERSSVLKTTASHTPDFSQVPATPKLKRSPRRIT